MESSSRPPSSPSEEDRRRGPPVPVQRLSVGSARTLPAVLEEKAKEAGQRPLLLRDGRVVATYASFRTRALRLAARLQPLLAEETNRPETDEVGDGHCGVRMRRPIAVLCANGPPLLELCMAAWYVRRPVLLLPTSATLDIIVDLIGLAEPLVLIHGGPGDDRTDDSAATMTTPDEERRVRAALTEQMETLASAIGQRCPQLDLISMTDEHLRQTSATEEEDDVTSFAYAPCAEGEEDEVCCVLSTSASTTGTSVKAVPLTHTNLLYSCVSRNHLWSGHIDHDDRVLGWLPMFHIMGLLLDFLNSALYCGGSYAFCPLSADLPHALIRGIQMYRPTLLSTVPWMLAEWRKRIEASSPLEQVDTEETLDALRSLKALLTGGAPIADDLALFFETRGVRLFQSEGMTECSGSLFTGHPTDTSFRTLRMHPSIEYEWLSVDPSLIEGGDGGGELVIVDSPSVTPGYLKNDGANAKAFFWAPPAAASAGGSTTAPAVRKFRTGDVFRVLSGTHGRCVEYICRVDDLLSLSTGEKMNPIAFEQRLRLHAVAPTLDAGAASLPLVRNVCLIGRGMPLAFAVIEPDYDVVDQAFAALSTSTQAAVTGRTAEVWLNAELWRAVARVNEGWSAACRVHRAAVIILGRHDEPLPVSRKKLVYRVLAEKRFADELKARTTRILDSSSTTAPRKQPAAATLPLPTAERVAETLRSLRECLAQVLAVPVTSLAEVDGADDQPFVSLGLTSLLAARLAGLVTERFNANVTAATLYTHITLSQLATFLLASHQATQLPENDNSTEAPATAASPDRESVAITGMSCRFPGGADDLVSYWELLKNGVDGITEVPRSRWDIDQLYDSDSDAPGKMHNRCGGFVEATERFDHRFFGISEHEATAAMDPRQRVALELVWEALETAGIPPRSLAGSRTGVFVALMDSPFQETLLAAGPPDLQYGTGGSSSVVAGRLSHFYKLRGPSMVVDTACSSSLVALDAAARAIRSGQCSKAIVCAVHAVLTPTSSIFLSKARMTSPNGRCATFDANADGYCRSEGYGAVVLERQRDVVATGRSMWGLLRGSAVNHNGGTSNGITAPSALAQREVLTSALADAGVEPAHVSLIEAHGTGTPVGDPIEMAALVDVYGKPRWQAQQRLNGQTLEPLAVASVKTNIGHAEPSSGMAGLIKVLLAMRHGVIPPHIHLTKLNPLIDLRPAEASLRIPTAPTPWRPDRSTSGKAQELLAGTNAHVVLSSPPTPATTAASSSSSWTGAFVLPWSATNADSLLALARRLLHHCESAATAVTASMPDADDHRRRSAAELCLTAALGRSHFGPGHRAAVVGRDIAELATALRAWIGSAERSATTPSPGKRVHAATARPRVCFVLSGQGSQYVGMGRELYESCQVFRQALNECDETWREVTETLLPRADQGSGGEALPLVAPSLVQLIYPSEKEVTHDPDHHAAVLNRTANSQPALLAWEYALARLWQSWGVEPASMTGHSLGEIVAAVIAGILTLREGLALVASRGWWMQRRPGTGAMAAVFATRERTEALIIQASQKPDRGTGVLVLAAVNGPASVVVSGDRESVAALIELAETEGVKVRPLDNVHSAFHSPLLAGAVNGWTSHVDAVRLFADQGSSPGSPEVISTTTTALLTAEAARSMQHWRQHALEAVLLWPAVASMLQPAATGAVAQPVVMLEIGPSSILTSQIRRGLPMLSSTAAMASAKTVPSLVKDRDSRVSMFDALAQLYTSGVDISWSAVYADLKRIRPDLRMIAAPTYAFLPTRCWTGPFIPSSAVDQQPHGRRSASAATATSGVRSWSPPDRPNASYVDWSWGSANDAELVPLRQHGFDGKAVLPAAAMLGLVSSALDFIASHAGTAPAASENGAEASLGVGRLAILSRVEIPPSPPTHTSATPLRLQLALNSSDKGKGAASAFDLYVVRPDGDGGPPVKCATGQLLDHSARVAPQQTIARPTVTLADARTLCQRSIDAGLLYDDLHAGGLSYGPLFRCVQALWATPSAGIDAVDTLPRALLSRIQIPDGSAPSTAPATILPAWVLDACLHTAGGFFIGDGATTAPKRTFLPVEFEGFRLHRPFTTRPGQSLWCLHQRVPSGESDSDSSLNTVEVTVYDDDGQVLLTIARYTSQEARPDSGAVARQLIYDIEWEEVVLPLVNERDVSGAVQTAERPIVVAFVDSNRESGACQAVLDELLRRQPDTRCVRIRKADEFNAGTHHGAAPADIAVRPDAGDDYEAALGAIRRRYGTASPLYILFGWALDVTEEGCEADLAGASGRASRAALLLLQTLASGTSLHPDTSIVFLTRDAVPIVTAADVPAPLDVAHMAASSAQASLHGLATVAATELPDVRITVVDLERDLTTDVSSMSQHWVQALAALIDGPRHQSVLGVEDRLAVRDNRVYAPRLTRSHLPTQDKTSANADSPTRAAVITGAFGGVGREICRRLLRDAHHSDIFLVGRHPPEDPAAWISEIVAGLNGRFSGLTVTRSPDNSTQLRLPDGMSVWFCRADVSRAGDVDHLFEIISASSAATLDVHHCAGALRDGLLVDLTWEAFAHVMAAKAQGALNLLRCCVEHKTALRSFALCSSVTNVVGTAGQANYAAANAMVECMAAHCRQAGLPVRAVCWGLWRDVGMASSHGTATEKKRSTVNAGGVRVLPMEAADALDAFRLLDDLATTHGPTVAIADITWTPRTARVSLWKRFTTDHAAPAAAIQAVSAHHGKADVSIEARLHALVCEVLAIDNDTAIPDDMLLAEVGFDSMSGMELRAALARDAGLWLPLKTFRSPTKGSILAAYHKAVAEGAQPTAASPAQAPLAPVSPSAPLADVGTVKPAFASKWLDFIGGNVETATLRVVCFGDAGGDPANFKSWLAFVDTSRVEVWALHLPRHTSRSAEEPCASLPAGAATFMSEAFPFLAEKPYALFGQCIGAYYALRFTEEMRNARRLSAASRVTLPVAILASACPGPSDLNVLTTYTNTPDMYEGLKALSLAIGWSEEEWERFASNTTLYQALVADVSMTGMACGVSEDDPIDVPITALLGDLDPVVKRRHVASWMGLTSQSFALELLRGQGHNMQFEPPLVACVNRLLLRLIADRDGH